MLRFASLVLLVVVGESMAQYQLKEACPTVASAENYDFNKIANIAWNAQFSYYYLPTDGGRCVQQIYTLGSDGTKAVTLKAKSNENNQTATFYGTLTESSSSDKANMTLFVEDLPMNAPFPYQVIATDNEKYLVYWSCKELDFGWSARFLWVLTVEESPSAEVVEKILDVLEEKDIDTYPLMPICQLDCSD